MNRRALLQSSSTRDYPTGALCVVNGRRDAAFDAAAKPFIRQRCRILGRTKGGLIRVALIGEEPLEYAFPQANIDLVHE